MMQQQLNARTLETQQRVEENARACALKTGLPTVLLIPPTTLKFYLPPSPPAILQVAQDFVQRQDAQLRKSTAALSGAIKKSTAAPIKKSKKQTVKDYEALYNRLKGDRELRASSTEGVHKRLELLELQEEMESKSAELGRSLPVKLQRAVTGLANKVVF